MDPDVLAVTESLDAAQARSGLGKAAFARALGTSPSRYSTYRSGKVAPSAAFLFRANRIADALQAARQRGIPSSIDAARSVLAARESRDDDLWAFTLVLEARDRLDDILTHQPELAPAWEAQADTGDRRWDRLFAALVSHAFAEHDLPAPKWTATTLDEQLAEAWLPVESIRYDEKTVKDRTPSWLAEHNIYITEHDLATA